MAFIGNQPFTAAFLTDTFSGTGSQTAFTMTVAPANTSSIIVAVTGVLQDPSTYSVSGTTLTFSAAPPSGTSNISVRYLGIPASGVTTTAYRTVTEFTATSGQTSFSVPSYTVGYIDVYRNGVMLGTADFTATTGTTVVLASGATTGDLIRTESFYVSSVLNAIPATAGSVSDSYIVSMAGSKLTGTQVVPKATLPTGSVLQVVNATYSTQLTITSTTFVTTNLTVNITPTSSTSKMLIMYTLGDVGTDNPNSGISVAVFKNGSQLGTQTYSRLGYVNTSATETETITSAAGHYYDSPATTSTLTYAMYADNGGGGTIKIFRDNTYGSITVMEIAA
jgi:hypothetical protein